jgi:hypothetical protein
MQPGRLVDGVLSMIVEDFALYVGKIHRDHEDRPVPLAVARRYQGLSGSRRSGRLTRDQMVT